VPQLTPEEKLLSPFVELGFVQTGSTGEEAYGNCPLCGKKGHFYVNTSTGQWACKSGKCQRRGNLITYLEAWCEVQQETFESDYDELSEDRELPVHALEEAGIFFDGREWVLPEKNENGRIANLRRYRIGSRSKIKLRALKCQEALLYGIEELADPKKENFDVWIVEGHWDRLALRELLREAKRRNIIVVAVPGADTFKQEWADLLIGRNVTVVYDNDVAGEKGKLRAWRMLRDLVNTFQALTWPVGLGEGYDIRDFYRESEENDFETLLSLVGEYEPPDDEEHSGGGARGNVVATWPLISSGDRPSFERDILPVYKRYLHMTEEHEWALRIVYAIANAMQVPGDPLWGHIAAVPGSCKTELIMSISEVGNCVARSSLTVHSLVSGFKAAGDTSLIPRLIGRVFLIKDFTEILNMPAALRHEIYGILRGAYDGEVQKDFGNGVQRRYKGVFNTISGVTPEVFRESNTALGERFLIYHMASSEGRKSAVRAALRSVGGEVEIRQELKDAAKSFLEYQFTREDLPRIPPEYEDRLINLAELVAVLRANVARDFTNEKVLYRPKAEMGTRLVKQLAKLMIGLGTLNDTPSIGELEYRIVQRVAIDSCVGWHFDTLQQLARMDGLTLDEIAARAEIPRSTLYDRLKDLLILGVLTTQEDRDSSGRRGRPATRYYIAPTVREFWEGAGLPNGKPSSADLQALREQLAAPKPLIRRRKPR
jgi:hypothetical protein